MSHIVKISKTSQTFLLKAMCCSNNAFKVHFESIFEFGDN